MLFLRNLFNMFSRRKMLKQKDHLTPTARIENLSLKDSEWI